MVREFSIRHLPAGRIEITMDTETAQLVGDALDTIRCDNAASASWASDCGFQAQVAAEQQRILSRRRKAA